MKHPGARARDAADPLAPLRARFVLPPGVIYLDGNSLGALPAHTAGRLQQVVSKEWGQGLIGSWNDAGWIDLPTRVGDRLARLIGAAPGEVIVADSTSLNLFKLLATALRLRPARRTLWIEGGNFPTDSYIAEGLVDLLNTLGHADPPYRLLRGAPDDLRAVDGEVALVLLSHVDYRSGTLRDMRAIAARAHAAGALVLFDLAHSAGAVPVELNACAVDFAVGCGYKYLNGGPGAPAFAFAAERHHPGLRQPLTGWLGHRRPFAFEPVYDGQPDIRQLQVGTPGVLGLAALDAGLDPLLEAGMPRLREKSLALSDCFIQALDAHLARLQLTLVTPRSAEQRGSQVSLRHPNAFAVMQALIARGIVGDFRHPDILRFGFAPLYVSFEDVACASEGVIDVLQSEAWRAFSTRPAGAVT
jgi:kynureninase